MRRTPYFLDPEDSCAEAARIMMESNVGSEFAAEKGVPIGIVTDGTRLLGLGDIGPEAALPVMEGKSLLFRYLGGVDAHPICLNLTDPQVNNSLGFPGIFRGVLDVRSARITDEMCIAAAEENGLNANAILPTMSDWQLFPRVATAVGMKAQELGLAQRVVSKEDLYRAAHDRIERARAIVETSMERGFIQEPPPEETVIYAG